jgi:protein-tyrosine-phosphatase/predicted ATP-grasp superfamily ATP-dependent carboligase
MNGLRKVLVLGDDTQSFLAVVRSLGRRGVEVHAAPFNFRAPALSSRYIAKVHRLPRYVGTGEQWCEATAQLLEQERFDYVVPVDDRNILCFQKFAARLAPLSRIAMPSDEAIEAFYDKLRTRELAERCRVAVPAGRVLRAGDSASSIAREFGLPVAVKPRRSYTLDSLHDRGKVALVDSEVRLQVALDAIKGREDHLVEAFFQGQGVGVSLLAARGTVLYAFEHHRLTEGPAGGSSLRVSAPVDPERLAACQRMLAELAYTGVAMFEFRRDPASGGWVLLEVNARFWGSLPLPLSLGLDFPYDLLRVLSGASVVAPPSYPVGVYGRNLLGDLFASSQRLPAGTGAIAKGLVALREVLAIVPQMLSGREHSDTYVRDDPSPGFAEVAHLVRTARQRLLRRLLGSFPGAAARLRRRIRRALAGRPADAPVLFLCQGNICRSPFAHRLLERLVRERAGRPIVSSAGLIPLPGRHSPADAVLAARRHGIDLSDHVSRFLDEGLLARARAVLVFDRVTLEEFYDRFPTAQAPVFSLAELVVDGAQADIEDPFGRGPEVFADTYSRIEQAVSELARTLGFQSA